MEKKAEGEMMVIMHVIVLLGLLSFMFPMILDSIDTSMNTTSNLSNSIDGTSQALSSLIPLMFVIGIGIIIFFIATSAFRDLIYRGGSDDEEDEDEDEDEDEEDEEEDEDEDYDYEFDDPIPPVKMREEPVEEVKTIKVKSNQPGWWERFSESLKRN